MLMAKAKARAERSVGNRVTPKKTSSSSEDNDCESFIGHFKYANKDGKTNKGVKIGPPTKKVLANKDLKTYPRMDKAKAPATVSTATAKMVQDNASNHFIPGIKKLSEKTDILKKWALHYYNLQNKVHQKSMEVANNLKLIKSLKAEEQNLKTKFVQEKEKASYKVKIANNATRAS